MADLSFFEVKNQSLIFRENGETVMVTPWGQDGLRVRAVFLGEIGEGSAALLEAESSEAVFSVEDLSATVRNGNITARLEVQPWGRALQISFYNQKGRAAAAGNSEWGSSAEKGAAFSPAAGRRL